MSRSDLALMSGVPLRSLQRIEESTDCRLDALLRVCGALGCPLGAIVRHPDREGPWTREELPPAPKPYGWMSREELRAARGY